MNVELIERFLDYLIDPNQCIDSYGRTYIDDLENIVVENHEFNFGTQTFPNKEAQDWFERIRAQFGFKNLEEIIAYVREHRYDLDIANIRPRSSFQTETLFEAEPTFHQIHEDFQKLKQEIHSVDRSNEFQREYSLEAVKSIPQIDSDADQYELYMSSDRVNPWTYLIRREIRRGNLKSDDRVVCVGNRWGGEILYFRQNIGLKNTIGIDLFSSHPDLVIAADMHKMPFPDNSVKMIFNRGLINKSYDVRVLVKEMLRVLTKDGFLIVETPGPYGYGVSRLGRTDIKSAENLLRLFRGKVRRIVFQEATRPRSFHIDVSRIIRLFIQIDKDGAVTTPEAEPFSHLRFNIYDAYRLSLLRARALRRAVLRRLHNVKMRLVQRRIKDIVRYWISWTALIWGAFTHWVTGKTPKSAHLALVSLFATSGGRVNDQLARTVKVLHPPYNFPNSDGVLGHLTDRDLARINRQLETDGYCVFENCLSAEFCESIVHQTLTVDCLVMGDEATAQPTTPRARYNRQAPVAAKYALTKDDTTDILEVQQLMSDTSLIKVAENYLRSKPIFTGISLWWSPSVKGMPDSEAAQVFHWDMERIRWLRYFIYLTDVTADSGPHCFIKGTHRTGAIPKDLLNMGYVRHSDDRIFEIYGKDAYREFIGPRGTIIAEDSRGFHKGKLPLKGDRLLLAFELSNTTFGASKRHRIHNIRVPRFGEFAKKYPRLYRNFDFSKGLIR
jgi:SAM-dependent methyltransferase